MIICKNDDLLSADADVICQQVNCQNVMGAGLAKAIYTKWPLVKEMYHEYCDQIGDPFMLFGDIQIIRSPELPFDVANVFGQLNFGRKKLCYTSYDAFRAAFTKIAYQYKGKVITLPYGFGCGLAGGDLDTVLSIIDQSFISMVLYSIQTVCKQRVCLVWMSIKSDVIFCRYHLINCTGRKVQGHYLREIVRCSIR